ncbi:hypothetical protein [uncultured Campylobacter sp.]|uniref:hypothetical protein n=1 Tax=uncultured Campylobacter sp. TaxID=218934 RepID=UPI0015A8C1B7|nr:hypothetical protein [uncultured Campylobacter sp.]
MKFKCLEILNAHKISRSRVRAFEGDAVLQNIGRAPKLRVNFMKFASRGQNLERAATCHRLRLAVIGCRQMLELCRLAVKFCRSTELNLFGSDEI